MTLIQLNQNTRLADFIKWSNIPNLDSPLKAMCQFGHFNE
jgi:hypothetical protein